MIKSISKLWDDHRDFELTIHWVPGHENIPGNEAADREAKKAAEDPMNNSPT